MKSNILKSLTNNIGYKILALMFAFTLWLIVYNTTNPMKRETYTINVTVTNASHLENLNKYYEIINGTNKVTFTVSGEKETMNNLDETDFTAVADMSSIVIDETDTSGTVPIDIKCNVSSADVKITATNKICKVALENLMSRQFVVTADAVGEVSSGHALGSVTVNAPNVLKVSGPESIVKTIAGVVATIDVEGMSMDPTTNAVPVLYDSEGKVVDTTRLKLSNSTVSVSAKILKTKEVPISVKTEGEPANGYAVTSITCNPTTVVIKGSSSVLNGISAIEVPSDLINIKDKKKEVKTTIDITEYLPEGAELVDDTDANVEIVVSIDAIKTRNFKILAEDIDVTGLETGLTLEFVRISESVTISGIEEDITSLVGTKITGHIDVKDLQVGEHEVKLTLNLDETKYTYGEIVVSVVISEDMTDTEQPTDTENTGDTENTEETETENESDV